MGPGGRHSFYTVSQCAALFERLGDVKEGRHAQGAVLKAFHNLIDCSMRLLYRGMAR